MPWKASFSFSQGHFTRRFATLSRSLYKIGFLSPPRYIARMQRRIAFATTTTTPGLPGAVGLRVTG